MKEIVDSSPVAPFDNSRAKLFDFSNIYPGISVYMHRSHNLALFSALLVNSNSNNSLAASLCFVSLENRLDKYNAWAIFL